jgi:hypothetical protein
MQASAHCARPHAPLPCAASQHPGIHRPLPAADGSKPWRRDPALVRYNPGWRYGPLPIYQAATENWGAYYNEAEDWGVGVYFPPSGGAISADGFVAYGAHGSRHCDS